MTTIAIDFKNKVVATDSQCTHYYNDNNLTFIRGKSTKIRKLGFKKYLTGCGISDELNRQAEFYKQYGYLDIPRDSDVIILIIQDVNNKFTVDKYITVEYYKNYFYKILKIPSLKWECTTYMDKHTDFLSVGSGCQYAEGAFRAGKSAKDSVESASKCDCYTDNDIKVVQL